MNNLRLPCLVLSLLVTMTACSGATNSTRSDERPQAPTSDSRPTAPTPHRAALSKLCTFQPTEPGQGESFAPPPVLAESTTEPIIVTVKTTRGDLRASLDSAGSPCTVESFLSLADQNYFDDSPCHRLTTQGIFVLQCGDRTGTGTGGPGYTVPDEYSGSELYAPGTLAMANIPGVPNSGGSQFFVVHSGKPSQLPPIFTVFGKVDDKSLKVVRSVARAGTTDGSGDGIPRKAISITDVDFDPLNLTD